jgi:putative flippase GtrA
VEAEVVHAQADARLGRGGGGARGRAAGRIGWFVLVGCGAAAVHWGVVVALVGRAGWHPLLANVLGWLVAFVFSYSGHLRLTFRRSGAPVASSAPRFFLVSALGFAVNEASYALLLASSAWRYDLLLGIVLVAVAVFTYLVSRDWAFAGTAGR